MIYKYDYIIVIENNLLTFQYLLINYKIIN